MLCDLFVDLLESRSRGQRGQQLVYPYSRKAENRLVPKMRETRDMSARASKDKSVIRLGIIPKASSIMCQESGIEKERSRRKGSVNI